MITVKQLMQSRKDLESVFVSPDDTVYKALQIMADENVGAVLVMEKGQMIGIFTERDYARKIILMGRSSLDTPIKDIMSKNMITVDPEQTLEECMELMTKYRIRHLPILSDGRLTGMVSMRDVVSAIISRKDTEIKQLEDYILGRGYGE